MPVTQTAKRALRVSKRKKSVNDIVRTALRLAIKKAKKEKTVESIRKAISLADKAAKKKVIHKNKASRTKKTLSLLLPKKTDKTKASKKTSK